MGCQGFKLVGCSSKGLARETSDVRCRDRIVILGRIQSGAYRGSSQSQLGDHVQGVGQGTPTVVQLLHIGRKFLAQAQRRGVHEVRPTRFD